MPGPDRQFDPVANSALGAVRASNRVLREVERQTPAPELPQKSQAQRTIRDGIKSVSSFSPLNILAGEGSLPSPLNGGGAPDPEAVMGDLPDPASALPFDAPVGGEFAESLFAPLRGSPLPTPDGYNGSNGSNGGSNGSNGGSNGSNGSNGRSRSRGSSGGRRGSGSSR